MLKKESFSKNIWECACGNGNLSTRLTDYGYDVYSSDLYDHGFGDIGIDFLTSDVNLGGGDIITNPPFRYVTEFIEKGLELTNRKLAIFARIQLLETKKRWKRIWIDSPLSKVYVFVDRGKCYKNNDKSNFQRSAVCYCWFVWDKKYNGEGIVDWINIGD